MPPYYISASGRHFLFRFSSRISIPRRHVTFAAELRVAQMFHITLLRFAMLFAMPPPRCLLPSLLADAAAILCRGHDDEEPRCLLICSEARCR